MTNECFVASFRKLIAEMLEEENVVINWLEEKHDFESDTVNLSITCSCNPKGCLKENEEDE